MLFSQRQDAIGFGGQENKDSSESAHRGDKPTRSAPWTQAHILSSLVCLEPLSQQPPFAHPSVALTQIVETINRPFCRAFVGRLVPSSRCPGFNCASSSSALSFGP